MVTNFNAAVTLTFTYTDAQVAGLSLSSLTIHFWDGTQWTALPTSVNTATRTVTAPTTHFTNFALMGSPEPTLQIADTEGTALVDGDLIKTADSFDIYIAKMVGAKKFRRLILNPDIFNSYGHLSWEVVQTVTAEEVRRYRMSPWIRAEGDTRVYEINGDGTRHWLNMTAQHFTDSYRDWNSVFIVNNLESNFYKIGPDITQ